MSPSTSVLPFEPTTKNSPASDSGLPDDVMEGDACAGAFADIFEKTADVGNDKPVGSPAIDAAVVAGLAMTPVGTPIPMHLAMAKTCGLTPGIAPAEAVPDDADGSVTDAVSDEVVSDDNESVEETDGEDGQSVSDSRLKDDGSLTVSAPLALVKSMVATANPANFPVEPEETNAASALNLTLCDARAKEPRLLSEMKTSPVLASQALGSRWLSFSDSELPGEMPQTTGAGIVDRIESLSALHLGRSLGVGSFPTNSFSSADSVAAPAPQMSATRMTLLAGSEGAGNFATTENSTIPASASSETNPADVLSKSLSGASGGKPDIAGESPLPEGNTLKSGEDLPGKILPAAVVGDRSLAAGIRVSTVTSEKYAGSAAQIQSTRKTDANLSTGINKKESLDSLDESLMDHGSRVGTETAALVTPMPHDSRHPRYAALQGEPIASGVGHSAEQGSLGRAASEAAVPNSKGAVAAVEAIRQITDAADVLWATERSGVNLKLKLDDVGVAVSVSYRDGEIRATFHADSPELRNALSTAWEKHVFSLSDQKPYRFAEPVFSSSNTSSNSEQGAFAQGYSMGGDSSRQSSQQAQRGNPDVIRRSRRGISSVGAPVAPSQTTQASENSSRLQAFA